MDASSTDIVEMNVDAVNLSDNISLNGDASSTVVADDVAVLSVENVSDGGSSSRAGQFNMVLEDLYAQRAARTVGAWNPPRRIFTGSTVNNMPQQPKTAFFSPLRSTSDCSVFAALETAEIISSDIQCMQRKLNGEVVITFKEASTKEKFLALNSLKVQNESYALQDIDRPLSFLTIYDAPFELSDLAIIKRLAPFCVVVNYLRGKFDFVPGVYNGLHHYRVRIMKPIPNFLRFRKYQIFLKYDGQQPTCRRCNLPGHFANVCPNKVCFNCENIGHESRNCPALPLCCLCKEDGHMGVNCRYSWVSPVVQGARTDESCMICVERSDVESVSSFKTHSDDSFGWAEDSDLSVDDDVPNENLPLIAAFPDHMYSLHLNNLCLNHRLCNLRLINLRHLMSLYFLPGFDHRPLLVF